MMLLLLWMLLLLLLLILRRERCIYNIWMTSSQQMRVIVINLRSLRVDGPFHVAAISDLDWFRDESAGKSTGIVAAAMTTRMTAGIDDDAAVVLIPTRETAGMVAGIVAADDAVETGGGSGVEISVIHTRKLSLMKSVIDRGSV